MRRGSRGPRADAGYWRTIQRALQPSVASGKSPESGTSPRLSRCKFAFPPRGEAETARPSGGRPETREGGDPIDQTRRCDTGARTPAERERGVRHGSPCERSAAEAHAGARRRTEARSTKWRTCGGKPTRWPSITTVGTPEIAAHPGARGAVRPRALPTRAPQLLRPHRPDRIGRAHRVRGLRGAPARRQAHSGQPQRVRANARLGVSRAGSGSASGNVPSLARQPGFLMVGISLSLPRTRP